MNKPDTVESPAALLGLLDSLLRGEIAAVETYDQAMEGLGDDPRAEPLRRIQRDHGDAIRFLVDRLSAHGGKPSTNSGAWGLFAKVVEGTAQVVDDSAALAALREGEEQGLSSYQGALRYSELPEDCREHVESTLIPRQLRHIDALARILEST